MTYTVLSGTLNSSIPYRMRVDWAECQWLMTACWPICSSSQCTPAARCCWKPKCRTCEPLFVSSLAIPADSCRRLQTTPKATCLISLSVPEDQAVATEHISINDKANHEENFSSSTWVNHPVKVQAQNALCRSTIGDRAFFVAAPRVWNSLPSSVTASQTLGTFKRRLKTHLFAVSLT